MTAFQTLQAKQGIKTTTTSFGTTTETKNERKQNKKKKNQTPETKAGDHEKLPKLSKKKIKEKEKTKNTKHKEKGSKIVSETNRWHAFVFVLFF